MKPLFGTFILKCVFIIKPPITYAQTYHTINCVSTVNNQHLTQDLILSVTHTQYMALVHCLPGDVLCHTAYCYTTKGNPPSLSSFILWIHPYPTGRFSGTFYLSLLEKQGRLPVFCQPPYLQRRGNRITVNDCPVTLYSAGNMATQIVYRQWNGQSVFLCKINLLVFYT